jgi:hypothetical protein
MQYAAHLPSSRSMIAPVVALAIGAAGAAGLYAALDGSEVQLRPTHVIVTETPAAPTGAVAVKDEAATAAAVGTAFPVNDPARAAAHRDDRTAAAIGQTSGARP